MAIIWDRCEPRGCCEGRVLGFYPTRHVDRDAADLEYLLEDSEVVPGETGVYFYTKHISTALQKLNHPLYRLYETLNEISSTIVSEGMKSPVANQGNSHDEETERADCQPDT